MAVDWDAEMKKLLEGKIPKAETHDPSELLLEVNERYTEDAIENIIGYLSAKIRLVLLNRRTREIPFKVGPVLNEIFIKRTSILLLLSLTLECLVMFDGDAQVLIVKFARE